MEIILLLIRVFLFGVFALAGLGKLLDLNGSEKAVRDFGIPEPAVKPAAVGLPMLELLIAVMFLSTALSWAGAILAVLLLLAFIGGMIYQMALGNAPDCHCFGQIHSQPVGRSSIIRNVGFLILALFLAVQGSGFQGADLADTNAGMVQAIIVLLIALLAATAVFLLLKVIENQGSILMRLNMLELLANDGVVVDRQEAGSPEDSLPIGAPFPDFELPDARGVNVKFEHLLSGRKGMLFMFVSPDCGPCKALAPDVEKWREEFADKFRIILVSRGTAADNLEKFGSAAETDTLIQRKRELAEEVMAKWTPTAIFVDANGDIASHPALGDEAIRELIAEIGGRDLSQEFVHFANGTGHRPALKIGESVPEFSLESLEGNGNLTAKDLAGSRKLVLSWSLSCSHCRAMIDEISVWEKSRAPGDPDLIILSGSARDAHEDIQLESPIYLDPGHKVAAQIGLRGTPCGIIVENGVIRTEGGIGSRNIWSLIGRRK